MEKIGLLTREKLVEEVKGKIKGAKGYFFIGFNKVEAFPLNNLRNSLRSLGAQIFVTKNSLFKMAFAESDKAAGMPQGRDLSDLLDTETGVVFVYDKDIVKACKALVEFSKENEFLKLKGAVIEDKKISSKEVSALAKLPSMEALLSVALSAIASPLTGFLNGLNQVILKFLWTVEEIKKKKERK